MSRGEWAHSSISLWPLFQFLTSGSFPELLYQLPSMIDWNLGYRSHINSYMPKLFLCVLLSQQQKKKNLEHKSFKTKMYPGMVVHAFSNRTQEVCRSRWIFLWVQTIYIASSKPSKVTWWDGVSKKETKKKKLITRYLNSLVLGLASWILCNGPHFMRHNQPIYSLSSCHNSSLWRIE